MNFLKNLPGRLLAGWAILMFVVTMLIFILPIWLVVLIPEPRRTRAFRRITNAWMRVFFFLVGLRMKISGRKNFQRGANYIIISNHNSMMDIPLTTPFIPGGNKTIAKAEMSRIPLFGMIYKRGSVLVDRKSEESRKNSYLAMKQVLEQGLHMCIYPEGTRNRTAEPLQPFHNGAFRLSVETGKAILPAVIFNTAKVLPAGKGFYFWPVQVRMEFLPPVEPGSMTADELKTKLFTIVREYYLANQN